MQVLDWLIVIGYMVASLALGVVLSKRASGSMEDFFVSGRSLSWWLAGTSMAATTFSIDTPLYIAGVVGNHGIAGNWQWWCFAIGHVAMIYLFARLWRRSSVITDAELTELRYGGRPAAVLRLSKAFLFAVLINMVSIGYTMLAAVKVVDGLGIWQSFGFAEGDLIWGMDPKLLSVMGISVLVLVYAGFSGLWGVVITDFFQFFLAMFGAVLVAVYAISDPRVGGLHGLVVKSQQLTTFDVLAFVPFTRNAVAQAGGGWMGFAWSAFAGITASTFFAYVFVQWWAFRRSDGGGEFIQRLVSVKDEVEAEKAAWFFNIFNYVVRTWPWILVALAALVLYPELQDKELGYPKMMIDFLPVGILGLVVSSLLAAFMSTVSTLINWGASYITNDLYRRFARPAASQRELVLVGRLASVLMTILGATAAFYATSIAKEFTLVIAIGTGPGIVLILRWFWWRINAWAELSAMLVGFIVGIFTTFIPVVKISDPGVQLMVITAVTGVVWIAVMLLTPPESDETLDRFYAQVRPGGPGWRRQRARTGLQPSQELGLDIQRVIAAVLLLFALMFGIGGVLLFRWGWAVVSAVIAIVGGAWLYRLRRRVYGTPATLG
ncbi:MAG TPA: sodium:solute symporter family protein [Rhodothermales bacterium]|nr:sodium:solute symporter family protein [Rhodothermales bacterium]